MEKILFVLPYKGLTQVLKSALSCFPDFEADQWPGYEEPVSSAAFLSKPLDGYSLIMAQGDSYDYLRKRCSQPVVEVPISYYDILAAAKLADGYRGKSILMLQPDLSKQARNILDLAGLPMEIYPLQKDDDVCVVAKKLHDDGYSLIITAPEESRTCFKQGITNIMLTTSYQTLMQSFSTAQSIVDSLNDAKKKLMLIQHYAKVAETIYIIFSKEGKLVETFNCAETSCLVLIAQNLISTLLQQKEISKLKMVGKQPYIFKGIISDIDGRSFLFFEIKHSLENTKTRIPGIMIKNTSNLCKDFFNIFYDDLCNVPFRQKVMAYSYANDPVVIIGESGTGKSRLADYIYDNSEYRNNLLYVVDCKQLEKYSINYMFRNTTSPLYSTHVTLYFKEINLANKKYIDELVDFLQQSACLRNNKVIFSITCKIAESFENRLCEMLMSKLGSFPLYLIPLRERINDIPNLATLYLNEMNQELGCNIVGFEPEAMSYLQGFDWYDNVKQFKRVLKQLFVLTQGLYVTTKDTISILHDETMGNKKTKYEKDTDKMHTLQELTFDAVQKAMLANGMNQTRAAKQLGISRTTLWRILK